MYKWSICHRYVEEPEGLPDQSLQPRPSAPPMSRWADQSPFAGARHGKKHGPLKLTGEAPSMAERGYQWHNGPGKVGNV